MNKTELVEAIAETGELTKASSAKALDATLAVISKALQEGDSVVLTGFGTFMVRDRPARMGRNPKTGEPMQIKASKTAVFKAGKTLKDSIE